MSLANKIGNIHSLKVISRALLFRHSWANTCVLPGANPVVWNCNLHVSGESQAAPIQRDEVWTWGERLIFFWSLAQTRFYFKPTEPPPRGGFEVVVHFSKQTHRIDHSGVKADPTVTNKLLGTAAILIKIINCSNIRTYSIFTKYSKSAFEQHSQPGLIGVKVVNCFLFWKYARPLIWFGQSDLRCTVLIWAVWFGAYSFKMQLRFWMWNVLIKISWYKLCGEAKILHAPLKPFFTRHRMIRF